MRVDQKRIFFWLKLKIGAGALDGGLMVEAVAMDSAIFVNVSKRLSDKVTNL
jgi:hypothetical protein